MLVGHLRRRRGFGTLLPEIKLTIARRLRPSDFVAVVVSC